MWAAGLVAPYHASPRESGAPKAGCPRATRHYDCTLRAPAARILRAMLPALRAGGPSPCVNRSAGMPDQTIRPDTGQLALELPIALPTLPLEPEWKAQPRLWGHTLHPMCSYLASFPAALVHAFIARYSRPGDVVLDPFAGRGTAPAPGGRRRAHRRRQRPEPAGPRPYRRQAGAGDAGRGAHAAGRPLARLGRRGGALAGPRRSRPRPFRAPLGVRAGRRQRRRPRRPDEPSPPRWRRVPSADARARCCSCGRHLRLDDRTDRFLAGGHGGDPARQDARLPLDPHAQHVQHGAALRARVRGRTGYEPPDRDVFDALAPKLIACTASPCPRRRASPPGRRARRPAGGHGPPCGPVGSPTGRGS